LKNKKALLMSLALTAVLSGCYSLNPYAGLYAPGGELADKHEGPLLLADITDESINAMFPKGTQKAQVMQVLGTPGYSSSSTDGLSLQTFTHIFTSYERETVDVQSVTVEYDATGAVAKLTLSRSNNSW
jgi:hypothetical protein